MGRLPQHARFCGLKAALLIFGGRSTSELGLRLGARVRGAADAGGRGFLLLLLIIIVILILFVQWSSDFCRGVSNGSKGGLFVGLGGLGL